MVAASLTEATGKGPNIVTLGQQRNIEFTVRAKPEPVARSGFYRPPTFTAVAKGSFA